MKNYIVEMFLAFSGQLSGQIIGFQYIDQLCLQKVEDSEPHLFTPLD